VYRSHFGTKAVVKAIHGGLECAVIGRTVPGIDMISFGPNIEGAHSPVERVNIASVEKFWQLLAAVLERLT
jgi:dipeptidase D